MYQGVVYRVSCADLGLPKDLWTRDASAPLANAWWAAKQLEIQAQPDRLRQAVEEAVKALKEPHRIYISPVAPTPSPGPPEGTLALWADRYLQGRDQRIQQGVLKPRSRRQARVALGHFTAVLSPGLPVQNLSPEEWERWGDHCQAQAARRRLQGGREGWAPDYARKVYKHARTFMRWLYEVEALPLPLRNLDRRLRFPHAQPRPKKTYTRLELHLLLKAAQGQHQLHILLGLNTGAYEVDIAQLQRSQVDLTNATITRRRVKTEDLPNTPEVTYPLWPATLKLLKAHLAPQGAFALLNAKGKPWATSELKGGKLRETHGISNLFDAARHRAGVGGSWKALRKTSATTLRTQYPDCVLHFLGESGKSVADRPYTTPDPDQFNGAVMWLGREFELLEGTDG
jgi:integrase